MLRFNGSPSRAEDAGIVAAGLHPMIFETRACVLRVVALPPEARLPEPVEERLGEPSNQGAALFRG